MLWRFGIAVSLFVAFLLFLAVAGFGFALLAGARPAWARALRRDRLAEVLPRAAIAAAGLFGLQRALRAAARVWPALFSPDVALPDQLAALAPWADPLLAALRTTFLIAVAASVAALAARHEFFKSTVGRVLGAGAILASLLPNELGTPGEFAASLPAAVRQPGRVAAVRGARVWRGVGRGSALAAGRRGQGAGMGEPGAARAGRAAAAAPRAPSRGCLRRRGALSAAAYGLRPGGVVPLHARPPE
jgi:hypothetical protein